MSNPTPKGNFLQTALIVTTIFLGYQIFFGQRQGPKLPEVPEEIHKNLVKENQGLYDLTIAQTASHYNGVLNQRVNEKRMTQAEADEKKLEAAVLVADTQRKAALVRNDTNRLRTAYQTLHGYKRQFSTTPLWDKQVDVADDTRSQSTTWSPKQLFDRTYEELNKRNHDEQTYGFLPGFQIIDTLVAVTGHVPAFSYALACLLLALIVRALIFPLAQKQLMFSRQMSQLVPLTNEIKAKYKDEPQQQQAKVMELYREYGINPLAGCFPALLQMPLFLTVYQFMLHYQFAFQKGTFLWINPSVAANTNGLTAPNLGEMDYPLIVLYGITMLISVLLAPVSDPTQAKQQRLMSVGMSVLFAVFMFFWPLPSAFVLYWVFTNILSSLQSYRAYRLPLAPLQKVNAAGGGVYPKNPVAGKWMKMMEEFQAQAAQQPTDGNGKSNGSSNGKTTSGKPGSGQVISNGEVKTGTPAKHKPKKRK